MPKRNVKGESTLVCVTAVIENDESSEWRFSKLRGDTTFRIKGFDETASTTKERSGSCG